jgi:hypothetical protein
MKPIKVREGEVVKYNYNNMAKSELSLEPQNITSELWYYEQKKGILIVHRITNKDRYIRTDQILIPWKKILASVDRYMVGKT